MRQLKVTAFFKRKPDGSLALPDGTTKEICDTSKLNQSVETPEITICDSDSDCEEIYCSNDILERRKSLELKSNKKEYCDADFVEFETYKYDDEIIKDKKTAKERRRCPFYKRIPYTSICVDAFNFAKEDSLKHYFLSHFHADHYIGLTKGFDKPLYCTPTTARLVRFKFKVAPKYIHAHELNEPFYVNNVRVTFFDANHCPGAAIILFELPNAMRYLHTGDFRANRQMEQIYDLKCGPIDCCFLDTTFCDKTKTFPDQEEVIDNAVSVCRYAFEQNPRTLIVCGSYCIGKERVFLAVAEELNLKVWCNKGKRAYLDCLECPRLKAVLVDKQEEAKLHVLPLKSLWKRGMREYLQKHYDHFDAIVALRPSGWEYKRNKHMVPETEGNIAIYPVPYSEHSSYTDLERFIVWLRPRRIIPTVNMHDPIKRGQMNHIFKRWQRTPFVAETKQIAAPEASSAEVALDTNVAPIEPKKEIKTERTEAKPSVNVGIDVKPKLKVERDHDHDIEESRNISHEQSECNHSM